MVDLDILLSIRTHAPASCARKKVCISPCMQLLYIYTHLCMHTCPRVNVSEHLHANQCLCCAYFLTIFQYPQTPAYIHKKFVDVCTPQFYCVQWCVYTYRIKYRCVCFSPCRYAWSVLEYRIECILHTCMHVSHMYSLIDHWV